MENLGLNNDVMVGGRKFHVQTSYSDSKKLILSKVFNEGQVIDSKQVNSQEDLPVEEIKNRINETHQELITEMEILYYIYEKVKAVRHAPSANKLGQLFLQKNLIQEAIEQFNLALEIDPNYYEIFAHLGKALLMDESYDKAVEILTTGVEQAPEYADIQNYLGIAHLFKENFDDAAKFLQEAIKLNPNYAGAHYHLGMAYLALSLNDEDETTKEEMQKRALHHLNLASEDAEAKVPNYDKVMEKVNDDDYEAAVDEYLLSKPKQALTHEPNIENEFYLKFMYGGKGKDDSFINDYIADLNRQISEKPDYADVRNNLGVAHLIQCRNLFLKSLEEFRSALKINPNFKKAEKNLKLAENDGKGFLILLRAILK